MGKQTVRQAARVAAAGVQAERRRERADRERRLEQLAVEVLTALGERDAAIAASEQRASQALRLMVDGEGLTITDTVLWCAEQISTREATRLRKEAAPAADDAAVTLDKNAGVTVGDEPGAGTAQGSAGGTAAPAVSG